MGFLSDDETQALVIERMIFHVVHPESEDPIFLAEITPPQFADFFIERIKETLKGSAYHFAPGSGMPALLRQAVGGGAEFIKVSRELADRFKTKARTDKRLAPGVLMLFVLKTGIERLAAIIKYEHQQVISYSYLKDEVGDSVLDPDGNPIPDLRSLVDTFTKDRKSMQKSAVIRFARPEGPDEEMKKDRLVVIDHSSGRYRDASLHYVNFLDIKRAMEPVEMTQRLEDAVVATIQAHKDEVPLDVARAPKRYVREAMARMEGFDHEKPEEFLGAIIHGLAPEASILKTFQGKLSRCGLATEAFKFEGAKKPNADLRKVVTDEKVVLIFSKSHQDDGIVTLENQAGGGVYITVKSTGLVWDDELDKMPRISD